MFIQLTSINDQEILINVNQIVSIQKKFNEKDKTIIVYNSAGGSEENYDVVTEPYHLVKAIIMNSKVEIYSK